MNNYNVYCHTNKLNGKKYIGITSQEPRKRWGKDGKGYGGYFRNAINKHGWNGFTHVITHVGLSKENAKKIEIKLIKENDTTNRDRGYNITLGGESASGYFFTLEDREKISVAGKGRKATDETRKKMSQVGRERVFSDETRKKMSESRKKRVTTDETRKKMSETRMGHFVSDETKKKMSEARRRR